MKKEFEYSQDWKKTGLSFNEVKEKLMNGCGAFLVDGEVYTGIETKWYYTNGDDGILIKNLALSSIFDEDYKNKY